MTNKEATKILKEEILGLSEDNPFYEAVSLAIKALKEVKGLRLLIDWAIDCDFGYDNIPEEYEKYKEEISDMSYTEGLIYIAKKETENE